MMQAILKLSTLDKIALLNFIEKNPIKNWTPYKIEWLRSIVISEVQNIGAFNVEENS